MEFIQLNDQPETMKKLDKWSVLVLQVLLDFLKVPIDRD